jgi:hypothetical protein
MTKAVPLTVILRFGRRIHKTATRTTALHVR